MADKQLIMYIVAAVVAFLIGLSKGGLGGTAGALATPMMALVLPADQVIGLILPILMFADIFAVALHWKRWNGHLIVLLLPGAVVGVTIGTFVIIDAPTELLRTLLGVIVLLFAVYKIFERRILRTMAYRPRNWHGLLTGIITGFSSALAHTGGPPVSIYLLMQRVTPAVFIGTSALFFFCLNWIKVPYYFYADLFDFDRLRELAWILPLVPLGVWTGRSLAFRIDRRTFENIIVGLLLVNAILLIVL
jgi:uncharacterized membrane protein YfcA